ncbi:MAG: hypothetical protein ACI31S_04215 [Bacilli bacterium]
MLKDYAVIFRKVENDCRTVYVPIDLAEGIYLENNNTFTAYNVALKHIIANEEFGYCNREIITNIMNKYKYMPFMLAKILVLRELKKCTYNRLTDENEVPVIIVQNNIGDSGILLDSDVINYYLKYFPNAVGYREKQEKEIPKIEINVNEIYSELKKRILGQDIQIKEILSIIWQYFSNCQSNKPRSILINGEKYSPKKEIFSIIENNIDIPVLNTSVINKYKNNISLNSISDILINLLKKSNFDIKKAENSIIVIDDLDAITILSDSDVRMFGAYQNDLIKLLNGIPFTIDIDGDSYTIDTNRMLIVLMGQFIKYDKECSIVKGFNSNSKEENNQMTREDYIYEGLSQDLIISVQNIIELDKPTTKEYIKSITEDEESLLNMSKKFLASLDIKLTIEENAVEKISQLVKKEGYAEEKINEIIDKALAIASFEIAINPNMYNELIITEETIKDNKKYILVKRNNE